MTLPQRHIIILILTIAFTTITLSLYNTNLKYYTSHENYVKLSHQTCEYSEDVAGPGKWISSDRWKPSIASCEYEFFTNVEFGSCISLKYDELHFLEIVSSLPYSSNLGIDLRMRDMARCRQNQTIFTAQVGKWNSSSSTTWHQLVMVMQQMMTMVVV
jgi:hypothetical protein